MPPVEAPKTAMERVIEKARAPDCRERYAGMGLFALLPLISNELGEAKCTWNRAD